MKKLDERLREELLLLSAVYFGMGSTNNEYDMRFIDNYTTSILKIIDEYVNKTVDSCMYDFPKSYSNSQISAFQKGIDKVWAKSNSPNHIK